MAEFVDSFDDLKELGISSDSNDDSLTTLFNKAADHLQTLLPNVDNQILLNLYGYYKQGTVGVCNTPKPSWYDLRGKAKWEAWNKLGNLPQIDAKTCYIETVKKLDPTFHEKCHQTTSKETWIKVSTMVADPHPSTSDRTIIDHIKEGNLAKVRNHLEENTAVIDTILHNLDEDGLALIHWAADSGCRDILQELISFGSDINLRDSDGQTPLHYASFCGHVEIIKCLIESGAKTDVTDNDGQEPHAVANDETVKELFVTYKNSSYIV